MSSFGRFLKSSVAGAVLASAPALAQAQAFDWEGFYAGATLGGAIYGVEGSDFTDVITNDTPNIQTFIPSYGISGHYNWRPYDDNLVLGAELDITFGLQNEELFASNSAEDDGFLFTNTWNSVIALRARAGMTSGRLHTFIAGGPAFADAEYTIKELDPRNPEECENLVCAELAETLTGISVGAGMEYAFRDDWIAKFEVMHYAMPSASVQVLDNQTTPSCTGAEIDTCTVNFDSSSTSFRFGFSYKF